MLELLLIYRQQQQIYTLAYNEKQQLLYYNQESIENYNEALYLASISFINQQNKIVFINYADKLSGFLKLNNNSKVQAGTKLLCQQVQQDVNEKLAKFNQNVQLIGKYVIVNFAQHKKIIYSKNLKLDDKLITQLIKYNNENIIIRSAVTQLGDNYDKLLLELDILITQKNKLLHTIKQSSLAMIYNGTPHYIRLLRDLTLSFNCQIITNDPEIINTLKPYLSLWQIAKLSLIPTFDFEIRVSAAQDLVNNNSVKAKVGGTLIIHNLSGINLIDVNSANLNLNLIKLNFLLLDEIIAQIKLRNLTGIILIDFMRGMNQEQQQKICFNLNLKLSDDFTKTKVLGFSAAGLCEIIRQR